MPVADGGQVQRHRVSAQRRQPRLFQLVAVKKIVGIEGNQAAIGMDDMDAGFLDRVDFESMGMRMEFQSEKRNTNRKGHGRGGKNRAPTLPAKRFPGQSKFL